MNPQQEIEVAVFDAASRIEDPAARKAFINWVFRDAPEEARHMNEVLFAESEANRWFERTSDSLNGLATEVACTGSLDLPAHLLESADVDDLTQSLAQRYTVLEPIGSGSGGQVFLAEQLHPVCRKVAIKLLRSGLEGPAFLVAFQRERQILATMNHPNIASILDAGTTRAGRPYLVMEFVEGTGITRYCDSRKLDLRQRLELFLQICQAVQHAHQKGIIHRDIKPSNIIVTHANSQALPKLIDFGIASAGEEPEGVSQVAGTPSYMSPEQAGLGGDDADTRADLFGLGVVLYELLAGSPPWAPHRLVQPAPLASAHLAALPAKPLADLAAARRLAPRQLISRLQGDLDAIIGKAVALVRRDRYETVDSLAADIRRHQDNLPVTARPANRFYLMGRFLARNRLVCLAGSAVLLTLTLGVVISVTYFFRERMAREEAERARATAGQLLRQATARENIAQAAILLGQDRKKEAEELLSKNPISEILPSTEATYVFRFLGERHALLGNWKEAAECFTHLMTANQVVPAETLVEGNDLLWAAPAILEANDTAAYHAVRENILLRLGATANPVAAEHLLKACLLTPPPRAMLEKLRPMVEILRLQDEGARFYTGGFSYSEWFAMATALFDLREGNHQRAREGAEKGLALAAAPTSKTGLKLILAMAAQAQGRMEVARRELAEATAMIERATPRVVVKNYEDYNPSHGTWYTWAINRILCREATARIGR